MSSHNLGRLIRDKRERKHLTVANAAELCGLSDRGLIRIELGDVDPKLSSLLKIAVVLEIDLGDVEVCKRLVRLERLPDYTDGS